MLEIFTVGGGEYIVSVLNAVAAWTGAGGYKGLIQVSLVIGLAYALLIVAFNQDWRAWINWFLGATLIYMCLMVPRTDIKVTDRINPALAPATVANVPVGLGLIASFTSQIGDYLTRGAEQVFSMPDSLDYSKGGMIYGARLLDATKSLRINDPEFAANLDEHFRQCVFYDLMLGHYSVKELAESQNIWATIAPGSPARAQKFLVRGTDDKVTANIITCRQAFASLNTQWSSMISAMVDTFGQQLYPNKTKALARARLMADLPIAYSYMAGVSSNATDLFRQVLTINAMSQAMHSMSGQAPGGAIDVFAQTRADIQTERTYASIAHNAMKWVPLLNIVLTVVFYALFPVLFPLFLMPKTGPIALKGYMTGFFYLAAWGPLFVVLNMMLMTKGQADVQAATGGHGLSLISFTGMSDVNSDIGLLAGYLVASIPFLAGGIAKGALAISSHATSYLNPSQNAAEEAAREASTGNISLGNSNIENSSVFSRQFAQGALNPSISYGAPVQRSVSASGTQTSHYPDAEFAQVPTSQYPFTPTLGQDFSSRLATMASESRTHSESYATMAQQSTSSAVTQFAEMRDTYSKGQSYEQVSGNATSSAMGTAFSEVDSASKQLQQQFGLSERASYDVASSWFLRGEASAGIGGSLGPVELGAKTTGGKGKNWTQSDAEIYARDHGMINGTMSQISTNRNWTQSREAFERETSTSSVSQISSQSSGITRSLTEAESYTKEARKSQEMSSRLEEQASWFETNSVAGSLNLSQDYRQWGMAEMAANPDYYGNARFDDIAFQMSPQGQQLQARFIDGYADRLHDDIEKDISGPAPKPMPRPDISSAADVRGGISVAPIGTGPVPTAQSSELPQQVTQWQETGEARVTEQREKRADGYNDAQNRRGR